MAIPVYSTRFYSRAAFTGNDSFVCPSGYVTVLRTFIGHHPASSGAGNTVVTDNAGTYIWLALYTASQSQLFEDTYSVVCEAGDTIHINNGVAADLYIGGYLLALP